MEITKESWEVGGVGIGFPGSWQGVLRLPAQDRFNSFVCCVISRRLTLTHCLWHTVFTQKKMAWCALASLPLKYFSNPIGGFCTESCYCCRSQGSSVFIASKENWVNPQINRRNASFVPRDICLNLPIIKCITNSEPFIGFLVPSVTK